MNPFDLTNSQNNTVHQYDYDWRHTVNFTGEFGKIYPVFCEHVPAKTSLKIQPFAGIQMMPLVFPVQTDIIARWSAYRMPLRSLWKDYKDYIGNFKKGLQEPYLDFKNSFENSLGVGQLFDHLDVPITLSGNYDSVDQTFSFDSDQFSPIFFLVSNDNSESLLQIGSSVLYSANQVSRSSQLSFYLDITKSLSYQKQSLSLSSGTYDFQFALPLNENFSVANSVPQLHLVGIDSLGKVVYLSNIADSEQSSVVVTRATDLTTIALDIAEIPTTSDYELPRTVNKFYFVVTFGASSNTVVAVDNATAFTVVEGDSSLNFEFRFSNSGASGTFPITRSTSPYYDSSSPNASKQLKLSAYKPRTYEAIYNCYIRDNRNNPYILNGQPEYNVWIPTDDGGADTTTYLLHNSNWEKDMFTTAVPSPQQGQAPLVGLTTYSTSDENGTMLNMALVDEEGKRYKLRFTSNDQELTGVEYSELSSDTPLQGLQFRNLVDAASTGISIPDFRIVNAYQRYLELNMRKGYSYRDIVEGRFDCKVRYDDLNMPEFIGGFTRKFTMNQVTQMVQRGDGSTYADALGSQAGDGYLSVSDAQPVSCFCDEESIVMCIISFTPVPVYTQVLDKSWLYSDLLDHYAPEFANLGFQPIRYSELCPVETFNSGDSLDDVFGYNRAWYEYCQKLDRAHGLYRTQLRNFLVNRVFDSRPELSKQFLLCDAKQVNDIFQVTDISDKFYGQITYACHAKLPIPKVSIPRLE